MRKDSALVGDLAIDHDFKVESRMLRVSRVDLDRGPTPISSVRTRTADGHQTLRTTCSFRSGGI
jgi:hypothetical protein